MFSKCFCGKYAYSVFFLKKILFYTLFNEGGCTELEISPFPPTIRRMWGAEARTPPSSSSSSSSVGERGGGRGRGERERREGKGWKSKARQSSCLQVKYWANSVSPSYPLRWNRSLKKLAPSIFLSIFVKYKYNSFPRFFASKADTKKTFFPPPK